MPTSTWAWHPTDRYPDQLFGDGGPKGCLALVAVEVEGGFCGDIVEELVREFVGDVAGEVVAPEEGGLGGGRFINDFVVHEFADADEEFVDGAGRCAGGFGIFVEIDVDESIVGRNVGARLVFAAGDEN